MRTWLVTALSTKGTFIDQRRIEASNQANAESYAYDWIKRVGGSVTDSKIEEIR